MKLWNRSARTDLADPLLEVGIALGQRLPDRRHVLARELEPQHVVLDPQAPQLVELGRAGRPGRFLAVEAVRLVDGEVEIVGQQRARFGGALAHALEVQIEDLERRLQPAIAQGIVEAGAIDGEAVDVGLQEEGAIGVERLQVAVEDLAGEAVVERRRLVVEAAVAEQLRHPGRGLRLLFGWPQLDVAAVGRRQGARRAERASQDQRENRLLQHGGLACRVPR
jgi:hypothetical protein